MILSCTSFHYKKKKKTKKLFKFMSEDYIISTSLKCTNLLLMNGNCLNNYMHYLTPSQVFFLLLCFFFSVYFFLKFFPLEHRDSLQLNKLYHQRIILANISKKKKNKKNGKKNENIFRTTDTKDP